MSLKILAKKVQVKHVHSHKWLLWMIAVVTTKVLLNRFITLFHCPTIVWWPCQSTSKCIWCTSVETLVELLHFDIQSKIRNCFWTRSFPRFCWKDKLTIEIDGYSGTYHCLIASLFCFDVGGSGRRDRTKREGDTGDIMVRVGSLLHSIFHQAAKASCMSMLGLWTFPCNAKTHNIYIVETLLCVKTGIPWIAL